MSSESPSWPLPPRQHQAIWQIKADKANKLVDDDGFPSAQQQKKTVGATKVRPPSDGSIAAETYWSVFHR